MRIIAGRFRSRELLAPQGETTRPTTDRARESLFNVLTNLMEFENVRVLDLFAGSGALAFEALSRGATHATLVEKDRKALEAIRKNTERLDVTAQIKTEPIDVFKFLSVPPSRPYDLILSDAPYDNEKALKELPSLIVNNRWLNPEALCVIEHRTGDKVEMPAGAQIIKELKAGEAAFTIFQTISLQP